MPKMDPLLKKAFEIIGENGWAHFELKDLADDKVSLAKVHQHFPSRLSLLESLGEYIDLATLESMDTFDPSETQKDRLFSVMMTRFDALAPIKPAIKSLWQDAWKDPMTIVCSLPIGINSLSWLLQAAGIDTTGIRGALRVKAFGVFYLSTVWTWLGDETEGLDVTMAALDTSLQRLAQFPQFYTFS
jgi:ubiquinone biosynthesis protein COQ9